MPAISSVSRMGAVYDMELPYTAQFKGVTSVKPPALRHARAWAWRCLRRHGRQIRRVSVYSDA